MKYMGGKERLKNYICDILLPVARDRRAYFEPFVGGASIVVELARRDPSLEYAIADANPDVTCLWRAAINGWEPPERGPTEEEYNELKRAPSSPFRTLVGFGLSFGGDWFRKYTGLEGHAINSVTGKRVNYHYWEALRESYSKKARALRNANVQVFDGGFENWRSEDIGDALVYCDPPYAGTSGYITGAFDSELFWRWCRSLKTAAVYVSEFTVPFDWNVVWTRARKTRGNGLPGKERLEFLVTRGS